ncbi:tetratricopeptide repeat protein, partial [Pseudofrancisella aestuarii]
MSLKKIFIGILFFMPCLVLANTWNDLWQTRDQQGMSYFNSDEYKEAANSFENDQWKGAANYKAGNYQQAYNEFKKDDSPVGLYNQGNALTQMGNYSEAIEAYKEAVKQRPDFEDAKNNLEIAKELEKEKDQNQNNGGDN